MITELIKCQLNDSVFYSSRIRKIENEIICYTGFGECVTICGDEFESVVFNEEIEEDKPFQTPSTVFDLFCNGKIIKNELGYISDWSYVSVLDGVTSRLIERDIINRFGKKYYPCRNHLCLPIVVLGEEVEFGLYLPDKNTIEALDDLFWICNNESEYKSVYHNIIKTIEQANYS